jgi:radical SAM-linked protein
MAMRVRITFSKSGPMQYVGHLDTHVSWERVFRRSGLPLSYSLGFHPQPRLNLACALPLGFTSECEILDAWLDEDFTPELVQERLTKGLTPGFSILDVVLVDLHEPALQTQVKSAVYQISLLDNIPDLDDRLPRIISAEHLPRQRRGKKYDLRPLVEAISQLPETEDGLQRMSLQLSTRDAATGRPEELLDELGIRFENTRIHRHSLIF